MAGLPPFRIFQKNKLWKYYLWRYISPCEKNFCSKDNFQGNIPKSESDSDNQAEDKGKTSTKQHLDNSIKTKITSGEQNKEAAKKKMFSLLSEIKIAPENSKVMPNLKLSKPLKRPKKTERLEQMQNENSSPEKKIEIAVAAVAESIGGNQEEIEKELNKKLREINLVQKPTEPDNKLTDGDIGIDENLQESLMSSVKDIASTVPIPIKSKLTQRLMRLSVEKKGEPQTKISIENMVKGMKIEKRKVVVEAPKKESVDVKFRGNNIPPRPSSQTRIQIFQSAPLDIFSLEEVEPKKEIQSLVWQSLEKKKLKLLTEFAPANAFEEMMMWTEQEKHWKFPIDNEIDMGKEENVGFHEHVFLDQHLHGFPTKGPVRHFIELVAIGLSKNPYITVERKIENINWFREYFKEKEDILKEYGVN